MQRIESATKHIRGENYDIALVRLSYPVADPKTGLTILPNGPDFNLKTIMPICLPSDEDFKDTGIEATTARFGLSTAKHGKSRCFTDGNGPSAFQTCAPKFVDPIILKDGAHFENLYDHTDK